jgi:NADPH-dependent 2,4-dienoyl-CoA reductase/sulfur reductase-like enzyme
MTEALVIGAGPAGMSAALELKARGLKVTLADDQPDPGGRIFAGIERREVHGAEERLGAALAASFRESGGTYIPGAEVWQIEDGPRVFLTERGRASMLEPRFVVIATGAQERPMPFPGWQLPGVMTVGAAQILLKTGRQIPDAPVWLAGSGPLLLLYARQLIVAGGKIAGILDTNPADDLSAVKLLPGALPYGWRDIMRGFGWRMSARRSHLVRNVTSLEGLGAERLTGVRYRTRDGIECEVDATLLLVHDGVIPAVHGTLAAGCNHQWNPLQRCFEPCVDAFGATSKPGIYVAGDAAGINGAKAAITSGKLAAVGIALAAGKLDRREAEAIGAPLRRRLASAAAFRRFIDRLYPPAELAIADSTMLCRCEEVTAGEIRSSLAGRPQLGPDGAKIATRAGMGPCQGRQCGLGLTRLVAEVHGGQPADIGFLRIRPPLKPITLAELAGLAA